VRPFITQNVQTNAWQWLSNNYGRSAKIVLFSIIANFCILIGMDVD